ncbi:nitrilase-related carbon-nitrogen hydrolase [Glutamicibacter sp.]|uniref:nitrilase-related carbon-nitrogen hydrolase n=1 Tax=Glutamicibacter sp. TaxID=1931995 RepID=UPI0028BDDB83|nr:nitrilase-related carbon-nitrogen hydrolase [Glutamicibacter sp.]
MLIAAMQAEAAVLDYDANLNAIDAAANHAAQRGARLLLTPELFVVGYAPFALRESFVPAVLDELRARLSGIAQHRGIALVYSMPDVVNGEWKITATFIDEQGLERAHYQKVHLFGDEEQEVFVPGTNAPAVFDYQGTTLGLAICFDVEYPELVREAARRGVEALLIPTAVGQGYEILSTALVPTRAMESQLYIAYANHTGTENGFQLSGTSVIAAPDGRILAQGGTDAEIIFADVEQDRLAQVREEVPYLREAKTELYAQWAAQRSGN